MASKTDRKLEALHERFVQARTADVPDLAEVRRCRERVYEYLADCVLEIMEADRAKAAPRRKTGPRLDVIRNDAPSPGMPKGPCSPVKTEEIRRFEESARAVFGDIESCTTGWATDP